MSKKILLYALLCLLPSIGHARTPMPKIIKFVVITGENINLRKAPNATSPRLLVEYNEAYTYIWENQKHDKNMVSPRKAQMAEVFPVVAETNDWIQILVKDGGNYIHTPYIMKRFTKDVKTVPITDGLMANTVYHARKGGKYNGIYWYYDLMNSMYFFLKAEDNVLKTYATIELSLEKDSSTKRINVSKNENNWITMKYGNSVSNNDEFEEAVDLNKLTDDEFGSIMRLASVYDTPIRNLMCMMNIFMLTINGNY